MLGFYELVAGVAQAQADRMEAIERLPSPEARKAATQEAIQRYLRLQSRRARERAEKWAAFRAGITAFVNMIRTTFRNEKAIVQKRASTGQLASETQ